MLMVLYNVSGPANLLVLPSRVSGRAFSIRHLSWQ